MADVASTLPQWSVTAGSNQPTDSTTIGGGLADNIQAIQAVTRGYLAHYNSVAIASAATTDLGANTGLIQEVSGTATITSFGTVSAGIWKFVHFQAAAVLTHNATSLILPGAANITCEVGDWCLAYSKGSGNWEVPFYQRAAVAPGSGIAIVAGAIRGYTYLNSGGDNIIVTSGECADATGVFRMVGAQLTKDVTTPWAVGTLQGGLDTGSVGNFEYYIYAIARTDTGVVDYLFSRSATAPTVPAGYGPKRMIGWFKRVAGVNVAFKTYETEGGGLELNWTAPTQDVSLASTISGTPRLDSVKTPSGLSTIANLNIYAFDGASGFQLLVCNPDGPLTAPVDNGSINCTAAVNTLLNLRVRTSSSGQVLSSCTNGVIVDLFNIYTLGFTWARRP